MGAKVSGAVLGEAKSFGRRQLRLVLHSRHGTDLFPASTPAPPCRAKRQTVAKPVGSLGAFAGVWGFQGTARLDPTLEQMCIASDSGLCGNVTMNLSIPAFRQPQNCYDATRVHKGMALPHTSKYSNSSSRGSEYLRLPASLGPLRPAQSKSTRLLN